MRRDQNRLPTKQLTPSARPVDTYYQPQERAVAKPDLSSGDQLQELGKALGIFGDKMGGWFEKEKKRQDAEAAAKGARLALDNNRTGWNEMLDKLKESDPAQYEQLQGANPWVERGYEEQRLKNFGIDYADQLDLDTSSNPVIGQDEQGQDIHLHDAKDPGMVSEYLDGHLKSYMQSHGLDKADDISLVENFLPQAREVQGSWSRKNAAERRAEMVDKRTNAMSTGATLQITQAMKSPDFVRNPSAVLQSLGATLGANIRDAYDNGVRDFDKLNEKTVEAVVAAAKLYEDPRILQVLDHIETSPGSKLGAIPKFSLSVQQAAQAIESTKKEKVLWEERMKDIRRRNFMETTTAPLIMQMMNAVHDPNATVDSIDISDAMAKLTKAGMVTEAMQLNSWRSTLLSNEANIPLNIQAYGEMQDKIAKGEATTMEIVGGTGKLWNDDVSRSLLQNKQFYDRLREDKDNDASRVVRDVMASGERLVKSAVTGAEEFSAAMDKTTQKRGQEAVMRYRSDLQSQIMGFYEEKKRWPKAFEINEMSDKLVQNISNNPMFRTENGTGRYLNPTEQKGLEGQVPNAKPGSFEPFRTPPEKLHEDLKTVTMLGETKADFLAAVTEYETNKRGLIPALAAYLGIAPEDLIRQQGGLYGLMDANAQQQKKRR